MADKDPVTWISGGDTYSFWTKQNTGEEYDAYCARFDAALAAVQELFPED